MIRPNGKRARLGGVLLAAALGALAVLAFPGIGLTKGHGPKAAGTIQSFDRESGELTVDLTEGGAVTGLVVRRTHIRCGMRRRHRQRRLRRAHRRHRRVSHASARRGVEATGDRRPDRAPADSFGEGPRGQDGTPPGASEGPGQGADRSARCIDHLVEGAIVKRADLVLVNGNAYYKAIGVVKPKDSADEEEPPAGEEQTG